MQRAFLYGFAWYATIVVIGAWLRIVQHQLNYPRPAIIFSGIAAFVAVVFFLLGKGRPANKSLIHAIGDWLLSFASGYFAFAGSVLVADYFCSRHVN